MALTMPTLQVAPVTDCATAAWSIALKSAIAPVRFNASTIANNPATSGNTPQEMSLRTGQGDCRLRTSTAVAVTAPQMKVGKPS